MPEVFIQGQAGRLEGRYTHSKDKNAPVALVLHPHPQHGGTMNNKVTFQMYQSFVKMGFSTLRFNFRGVGKSHGSYDRGEGELADAADALDWLQTLNPSARQVWVSGFSFGAWIAMQLLMRRPQTDGFVVVAPPANVYDFSFLAPCPTSGLVLVGDKDDIVPDQAVAKLVQKLSMQRGITIDARLVPGANHFFADQIDQLAAHIEHYLAVSLNPELANSEAA